MALGTLSAGGPDGHSQNTRQPPKKSSEVAGSAGAAIGDPRRPLPHFAGTRAALGAPPASPGSPLTRAVTGSRRSSGSAPPSWPWLSRPPPGYRSSPKSSRSPLSRLGPGLSPQPPERGSLPGPLQGCPRPARPSAAPPEPGVPLPSPPPLNPFAWTCGRQGLPTCPPPHPRDLRPQLIFGWGQFREGGGSFRLRQHHLKFWF